MKKILLWTPLVCLYFFMWMLWWEIGLPLLLGNNMGTLIVLLAVPLIVLLWKSRHSKSRYTMTIFIFLLLIVILGIGRAIFFQEGESVKHVRSDITLGENNEPQVTFIADDNIVSDLSINSYSFDGNDRHFLLVHDTSTLEHDAIGHDFPPTGLYLFEKKDDQYVFLAHQSIGFRGIFSSQGLRYRHSVSGISDTSGSRRDYLQLEFDYGEFAGSSMSWSEPSNQYTITWDLYAWDNHWMTDTYDVVWRYSPLRVFSWAF